jgi:hypothetical protein
VIEEVVIEERTVVDWGLGGACLGDGVVGSGKRLRFGGSDDADAESGTVGDGGGTVHDQLHRLDDGGTATPRPA